jgi:hypothetical protein
VCDDEPQARFGEREGIFPINGYSNKVVDLIAYMAGVDAQ